MARAQTIFFLWLRHITNPHLHSSTVRVHYILHRQNFRTTSINSYMGLLALGTSHIPTRSLLLLPRYFVYSRRRICVHIPTSSHQSGSHQLHIIHFTHISPKIVGLRITDHGSRIASCILCALRLFVPGRSPATNRRYPNLTIGNYLGIPIPKFSALTDRNQTRSITQSITQSINLSINPSFYQYPVIRQPASGRRRQL